MFIPTFNLHNRIQVNKIRENTTQKFVFIFTIVPDIATQFPSVWNIFKNALHMIADDSLNENCDLYHHNIKSVKQKQILMV